MWIMDFGFLGIKLTKLFAQMHIFVVSCVIKAANYWGK